MIGFKYRSDVIRDIDEGVAINKLYASSIDQLNDPSEMNFDDSSFIDFLEQHKKYPSVAVVKRGYDSLIDFIHNKSGILSLSKDVYNELLWAYYADGHKGFCIEYDTDVIKECYNYGLLKKDGRFVEANGVLEREPMVLELDVKYQNSFPVINNKVFERMIKTNDRTECLTCMTGTKSKNWEHENEIRLIFSKIGLCEYDYRAVKGIYFGCRFDDSNNEIKRIMKILKGRGIKYYKMKFNPKSYLLSCDEIVDDYISASPYVANSLPYSNVKILSTPEYTDPYRDLLDQALEYVSKEPCIKSIYSARVLTHKSLIIAVETIVNEDFNIFPKKIFRFDMDLENRTINLLDDSNSY